MESIRIEIINPKAKSLIKNLADMDLIRIKKEKSKSEFSDLLAKLRNRYEEIPSIEEITKEVESIRKARYENQKSNS
jgi:precorrin-2 methylase